MTVGTETSDGLTKAVSAVIPDGAEAVCCAREAAATRTAHCLIPGKLMGWVYVELSIEKAGVADLQCLKHSHRQLSMLDLGAFSSQLFLSRRHASC
jgi:hypothetical protein